MAQRLARALVVISLFVMGGLDPPTQCARVGGRTRFIRAADATRLGGRFASRPAMTIGTDYFGTAT